MFCSTCGTEVIEGLNYCKNCGARVGSEKEESAGKLSDASLNTLIGCIFALPIAGIGIIIGLLVVLKRELGLADPLIAIVTIMSFIMLLISEFTLIRLLMRSTKKPKEPASVSSQVKDVVMKSFKPAQTRGLSEGTHEPIPSVIENTTRNLEPVYREPNER